MIKLSITKTNPDWLEAIWIEELEGELQTVQNPHAQPQQLHCESYSGHTEHIQMLRDKCIEYGTELTSEQEQIIEEITTEFVMPTQEELDEIARLQVLAENSSKKASELASIVVETSQGNSFDGNETARNNMVSAIMSADLIGLTEAEWKLADNTVKTVTLDELKEALALAIQEVGNIVRKY